MNLPKEPVILLSYINTQLRDFYKDLDTFCLENQLEKHLIIEQLSNIDYQYDTKKINLFK